MRNDPLMLCFSIKTRGAPSRPACGSPAAGRRTFSCGRWTRSTSLGECQSPIRTVLTVSMGRAAVRVPLTPGVVTTFDVLPKGFMACAAVPFAHGTFVGRIHSAAAGSPVVRFPESRRVDAVQSRLHRSMNSNGQGPFEVARVARTACAALVVGVIAVV